MKDFAISIITGMVSIVGLTAFCYFVGFEEAVILGIVILIDRTRK